MPADDIYSTYEAKSRFSEVIRFVREGRTITVTYQGEPVAEIRPLERTSGTDARIAWLRSRGILSDGTKAGKRLKPTAERPGGLDRFLADRHE